MKSKVESCKGSLTTYCLLIMKGYLIFMIDKTNFTKGSQDTFFAGTLEEASETVDSEG